MNLSIDKAESSSVGKEPLAVLGFKSERDLEAALFLLMQPIEEEDLIVA